MNPIVRLEGPNGELIIVVRDQIAAIRQRRSNPKEQADGSDILLMSGQLIRVKESPDAILARGR